MAKKFKAWRMFLLGVVFLSIPTALKLTAYGQSYESFGLKFLLIAIGAGMVVYSIVYKIRDWIGLD